jgi:hypothetical protein
MASTYQIKIETRGAEDPELEAVNISIGNPSVEHITGVLHLYRSRDGQEVQFCFSVETCWLHQGVVRMSALPLVVNCVELQFTM